MKRLLAICVIIVTLLASMFEFAGAETVKLAYSNGSLKLRNKPNTSSAVNAYLSNNQHITVLSKGSVWSKVKTDSGKVGYIKNLYIKGNGSSYASGTTYYNNKYTAYIKTKYSGSKVNLRSGASASKSAIGTLSSGAKVTVLGKNGSWYLVSTSKGTQGYVKSTYISKSKTTSTTTAKITGSVVYVRKSASSSSKALTALSKGTKVTVLSKSNSKWWKVKYGNYTGYVYSKYLK